MSAKSLVIAIGQSWEDLDLERSVLSGQGIEIVDGRNLPAEDPRWAAANGILLGTADRLDAEVIDRLNSCRGIARYGMGYDNIDVAAAEAKGIPVCIVRDYCLDEVAEHTLAAALSLARGLPHWDRQIRAGKWRSGPRPPVRSLMSLDFAIIGFGMIGREVARRANALFGHVLIHDPLVQPDDNDRAAYEFFPDLEDLLPRADILSLHVPLLDRTNALIGRTELALMKPTSLVINVSRGGIVDETELLQALRDSRLGGAAIDTFVNEPLPVGHPFLDEPRLLLSPHIAWLSMDSEIKLRQRASEEICRLIQGRAPMFPVNTVPPVLMD